jgi:hypothetical protein
MYIHLLKEKGLEIREKKKEVFNRPLHRANPALKKKQQQSSKAPIERNNDPRFITLNLF